MKKSLLLVLVALLLSGITYGQFALGIRAGYNANKLSTNLDSIKNQVNSGFHVGAWAHLGKRLYLAPGLNYSMSGGVFTQEGTISTSGWKQKITIGSLDIPVLLGFKIIHSDFITWRLELGPEASFVVNKKISDEGSTTPPITIDDINTANWYALGGTGIDFLFLAIDIRYKYGLSQLISDAKNYQFNTQNNYFVVSVGWKIFGKK